MVFQTHSNKGTFSTRILQVKNHFVLIMYNSKTLSITKQVQHFIASSFCYYHQNSH